MGKISVKGINIKLQVEFDSNRRVSYCIKRYGALERFSFIHSPFMEYVYITAREVREILSEEHPYQRFKIAERVFNGNFDSDHKKSIKITEEEIRDLEKEFDFP